MYVTTMFLFELALIPRMTIVLRRGSMLTIAARILLVGYFRFNATA